jgi:hypothetical protein
MVKFRNRRMRRAAPEKLKKCSNMWIRTFSKSFSITEQVVTTEFIFIELFQITNGQKFNETHIKASK